MNTEAVSFRHLEKDVLSLPSSGTASRKSRGPEDSIALRAHLPDVLLDEAIADRIAERRAPGRESMKIPDKQRDATLVVCYPNTSVNAEQNRKYGNFMANAIERASDNLQTGKIANILELLFIAQRDRLCSILHVSGFPESEWNGKTTEELLKLELTDRLETSEIERETKHLQSFHRSTYRIMHDLADPCISFCSDWSDFGISSEKQRNLHLAVAQDFMNEIEKKKRFFSPAIFLAMHRIFFKTGYNNPRSIDQRKAYFINLSQCVTSDKQKQIFRSHVEKFLKDSLSFQELNNIEKFYVKPIAIQRARHTIQQYLSTGSTVHDDTYWRVATPMNMQYIKTAIDRITKPHMMS